MPEGGKMAGSDVITAPVYDDKDHQPPPSQEAPRGWVWKRGDDCWRPRQRGPVLYQAAAAGEPGTGPVNEEPGPPQQDPPPGWMRQDSKDSTDTRDKPKFEDVPQAVKDDIAGLAGLVATPILAMIQSVDPYCGGALAASFEGVLDATLPLICRSERIVRYFTDDKSDWLLWGKVAMALAPVGQAIVEHHVTRTVHLVRDEQTGQVHVVRGKQAGQPGDHLTPAAQPEYDATAYAA